MKIGAKKSGAMKKIILVLLVTILLFVVLVFVNLMVVEQRQLAVSKGQPIEAYSESRSALLVIDIQEATTGEVSIYSFFKENSDVLIRNINQIAENFNEQKIPIIYVRSEISNPLINLINSSYAKGSRGASYDKRLQVISSLEVVKDGEDSFNHTVLDNILTSSRVNELYVVGLDAADCVNSTIKAAQNRNYKVTLIEEALLSKSKEMKDSMIHIFKERGVKIIKMDRLPQLEL